MKKIFYLLLFSALLITGNAFVAHAQGIHQLWGMTTAQGRFYQGTIFTTTQAERNPTKQFDFNFDRAGALVGAFIEHSGEFYVTAVNSERTNQGILFKWNPVTDEYKVLHEFKVDEGTYPNQILALVNNKIYGTTILGITTKAVSFLNSIRRPAFIPSGASSGTFFLTIPVRETKALHG